MAKRFYDPEVERVMKTSKMVEAHKAKTYDYKINDFIIEKNKWRYKDWKCWMQGTRQTVKNYIKECRKPYELRNLDGFHLVPDE
jgi:hypothetical protein